MANDNDDDTFSAFDADDLGIGDDSDLVGLSNTDIDLDADDLDIDDDEDAVDEGDAPDPLADYQLTGDLEVDTRAEVDIVMTAQELELARARAATKADLQRQDKNQRKQFKNLYDANYYVSDVYRTAEDCEYGKRLLALVLGVNYQRSGSAGMWRNGHDVTRALERFAKRMDIDVSSIPKP